MPGVGAVRKFHRKGDVRKFLGTALGQVNRFLVHKDPQNLSTRRHTVRTSRKGGRVDIVFPMDQIMDSGTPGMTSLGIQFGEKLNLIKTQPFKIICKYYKFPFTEHSQNDKIMLEKEPVGCQGLWCDCCRTTQDSSGGQAVLCPDYGGHYMNLCT